MLTNPASCAIAALLVLSLLPAVARSANPLEDLPRYRPPAPKKDIAPRTVWPDQDYPRQLRYFKDGQRLVNLAGDHVVRVWDVKGGKQVASFGNKTDWFSAFALSPDEKTLAALGVMGKGREPQVAVYDLKSGKLLKQFAPPNRLGSCLCFKADGSALFLGGPGSAQPEMVDHLKGRQVGVVMAKRDAACLAASPCGRWLAIGPSLRGGKPAVWNLEKDRLHHELTEFRTNVQALAFSPDGKELAVLYAGGAVFYDIGEKCKAKYVLDLSKSVGHIGAIAYSADGRLFAAGGGQSGVVVWDRQKKELHGDFKCKTEYGCTALAFSPDGRTLAAGTGVGGKNDILFFDVPPVEKQKK